MKLLNKCKNLIILPFKRLMLYSFLQSKSCSFLFLALLSTITRRKMRETMFGIQSEIIKLKHCNHQDFDLVFANEKFTSINDLKV